MMLREFIDRVVIEHLNENLQLADKIYFKSGKLSDEDREIIIGITGGDNYTKLISDFYYSLKGQHYDEREFTKEIKLLYNDVLTYNKNVYPIIGYDVLNPSDVASIASALGLRRDIIKNINKLPSIAVRNMKNDIREQRTLSQLNKYLDKLKNFVGYYSLLDNKDENVKLKFLRKMFKKNVTLDDLLDFVEDKSNLIGGVDLKRSDIKKLSQTEDFEIIYDKGHAMIIRVDSPFGIKAIGCNSLWCFTYGSGFDAAYKHWNNHSYNDTVYVLVDFRNKSDSPDFMYVLIKPLLDEDGELIEFDEDSDEEVLFDMMNDAVYAPYYTLEYLFGDNFESIIKTYLTFDY